MKRLMPTSLIDYLSANTNNFVADLFQISLPNGQTINATSGQWGITVPSGTNGWVTGSGSSLPTTTFHATDFGIWSRGAITSEAGFDLNTNTMDLTCQPSSINTLYPGLNMPILQAALNGLFDFALVNVWTVYMPLGSYGDVSNGVETKFLGQIAETTEINSTHVTFAVGDPFYLLNLKIPTRTFKPDCAWNFGDGNCNPPGGISAFTQAFTAASGSTVWSLTPATAFSQAAGYFTQGIATCVSGANAGLSQTVKLHASGVLTMMNPWLIAPNVGDTFSVVAGCDRTPTMCQNKFSNLVNFGGTTFVPPASQAV
jgi:uncharacterized phage protein (TIGR02218 family)